MKRIPAIFIFMFALLPLAGTASFCHAAQTAAPGGEKTAIVIVSRGTALEEGLSSLLEFEKSVQAAYPTIPVLRAFTATEARDKVRGTADDTPSFPGALSILADTGYSLVAVLATHTLPDDDYNDVLATARHFESLPGGFRRVAVSLPLLGSEEDAYDISAILLETFPVEPKSGEAVVFVGPDAAGIGSLSYPALSWGLFRQGKRGSLHLVATYGSAESFNEESFKDCLGVLKLNKMKTVKLVPLMTTADERAESHIYGSDAKSFAARLTAEGLEVRSYKKGLGTDPAVAAVWRAKLQKTLDSIK